MTFLPDGSTLASSDNAPIIRFWDARAGKGIRRLSGIRGQVDFVVFSPDAKTFAADFGRLIYLRDSRTAEDLHILKGHTDSVRCLAYSPDGNLLASGGHGVYDRIRLWNARTGEHLHTLGNASHFVHTIVFSPDGNTLASASHGAIRLWDTGTQRLLKTFRLSDDVGSLAFSTNGNTLAIGGHGKIRLFDRRTGDLRANLEGHNDTVHSVKFSPDGMTLASGSADGTILLWDLPPSTLADVNIDSFVNIRDLMSVYTQFGETADNRADINRDSVVDVADLLLVAAAIEKNLTALYVHPQSVYTEICDILTTTQVNDWLSDARRLEYRDETTRKGIVALEQLLTALTVWSSVEPHRVAQGLPKGAKARLSKTKLSSNIVYSPNGKLLAVASGRTISFHEASTGAEIGVLSSHSADINCLAFSHNGLTIASGSNDNTVLLWDARTTKQRLVLKGHKGPIHSVAFSLAPYILASAGMDGTIQLWDAFTGKRVRTLEHSGWIKSLAFSPRWLQTSQWGVGLVRF